MIQHTGQLINQEEKILLVDDEAAIRKLLRSKLTSKGYVCEEANCADQALQKQRKNPADLIILDIMMPGKSGIELLSELKTEFPDTAVIMATAVAETSVAIDCLKMGADDYIAKPFNLDDVVRNVARTMEKRKLQLQIKEYHHHLEEKVGEQTAVIRQLFLNGVEALVFALEAKDKYTGGHSRRVTQIATALGKELNLTADEMENLRWASLLHDVGKIAVDQLVQNKHGRLTREEYEHIMIHAQVGAGIVKPLVNQQVVDIIGHHHDRYDGNGLHQVTIGDEIPLGARILALADSYDAMTSDRPYRDAMSNE